MDASYKLQAASGMAEYEALLQFNRQAVSLEMVHFLAATAASVISISQNETDGQVRSLVDFIKALIKHSNVQTPTLMATTVYLIKLRSLLPSDVCGIATTRHRILIGCLILAAKNLNDSSPLNKHWTSYTDGLFTLDDVNTIERELLSLFQWDLNFSNEELAQALSHFVEPIKCQLAKAKQTRPEAKAQQLCFNAPVSGQNLKRYVDVDAHSRSSSHMSIPSLSSSNTLDSMSSAVSASTSSSSLAHSVTLGPVPAHKLNVIKEETSSKVTSKRKFNLTRPIILNSKSQTDLKLPPATTVLNTSSISSKSGWTSIFR